LDDTAVLEGAKAVLEEAHQRASSAGVTATTAVTAGDPAGVLVDMSKEFRLVVVGTSCQGGFTGRLLGTVSSALPAHAYCPTVVVPVLGTAGERVGPSSVVPMTGLSPVNARPLMPIRRTVVGVDGSPTAELALRAARAQADVWDCELVAVAGVPV